MCLFILTCLENPESIYNILSLMLTLLPVGVKNTPMHTTNILKAASSVSSFMDMRLLGHKNREYDIVVLPA
jgi:hypothetical protein